MAGSPSPAPPIGYSVILIFVATVRELFGAGSLLGVEILKTVANGGWYEGSIECLLAPWNGCIPSYPTNSPTFIDSQLASLQAKSGYDRSFQGGAAPTSSTAVSGCTRRRRSTKRSAITAVVARNRVHRIPDAVEVVPVVGLPTAPSCVRGPLRIATVPTEIRVIAVISPG